MICAIELTCKYKKHRHLSYGFVANLVIFHAAVCPWLSRDKLNNTMRKRKRMGNLFLSASTNLITTGVTENAVAAPVKRVKGGRPLGTTYITKKNCELAVIAAKNEISERYDTDTNKAGKKCLPIGHFTRVICEVRKSNVLPDDIVISEACIWKRFKKKSFFVASDSPGPLSPLHNCEMEFVQVLIQMSKMRHYQSPTKSITLITIMIEGIKS